MCIYIYIYILYYSYTYYIPLHYTLPRTSAAALHRSSTSGRSWATSARRRRTYPSRRQGSSLRLVVSARPPLGLDAWEGAPPTCLGGSSPFAPFTKELQLPLRADPARLVSMPAPVSGKSNSPSRPGQGRPKLHRRACIFCEVDTRDPRGFIVSSDFHDDANMSGHDILQSLARLFFTGRFGSLPLASVLRQPHSPSHSLYLFTARGRATHALPQQLVPQVAQGYSGWLALDHKSRRAPHSVKRPISVLRFWISEGLTRA